MSDALKYIAFLLISMASAGLVFSLLIWLLTLINFWFAFVTGLGAIIYLAVSAVQMLWGCSVEPVFVPPTVGSNGEGRFIHVCDSPGELLSYGYAMLAVPVAVLTISICLRMIWEKRSATHV